MSSRTLSHPAPTCFQLGARESGHTLFHNSRHHILHFFFFSKPAISLTEADQALLLSPNVSRVGGGVHRYVFFSQDVDTVERGRLCGTSLKYAIYAQAVAPPNAHNPHVLLCSSGRDGSFLSLSDILFAWSFLLIVFYHPAFFPCW